MAFELLHKLIVERFTPKKQSSGESVQFKVDERGKFPVLFAGRLNRGAQASFTHRVRFDTPGPDGSAPLHGGVNAVTKIIPLTLRVFSPDGREFTGTDITLADLRKHRDLRGSPSGLWSFTLTGESEQVLVDEDSTVADAMGTLGISIKESVPSESAPPLIDNVAIASAGQSFRFDLFRVGTFVAEISQLLVGAPWRGSMRLLDPDGVAVAQTTQRRLSFPVELRTLDKSRDAQGRVRKWTLEASPKGGVILGRHRVNATVIGSARIRIPALKERIDKLLGPRGEFIKIFGENKGGKALGRLKITDVVSAETIDMHGLLDGF